MSRLKRTNKLLVILGPTSSGKSDLAVHLAKKFNGEIISADSRQIYKGMNIGSGKITKKEMRGIPHYLLDVASPKKRFTVAQFQKLATHAIEKIQRKNKLPILCGGTGLYIQSVVDGLIIPEVPPDEKLRAKLEKLTTEKLFAKLQKLDPRRAKNIDRHNRRRLIRAIEIIIKTGKPVPFLISTFHSVIPAPSSVIPAPSSVIPAPSSVIPAPSSVIPAPSSVIPAQAGIQNTGRNKPIHLDPRFHGDDIKINFLQVGITQPKKELKTLIKKRLLRRLKQGMIAEVKKLHAQGLSWKRLEEFGLEYRDVAQFLQNKITKQEMIDKIQKESEQYAKRQMTWFRRDKRIKWIKNYSERTFTQASLNKEAEKLTRQFLS